MPNTVFDSSAVLTLLFDEPSAEKVESILQNAADDKREVLISAVNWAEVLYRVLQMQGNVGLETARKLEDQSPLKVVEVDRDLAEISARLKLTYGLPLIDAFCAALVKKERAMLVTSDRDFEAAKGEVRKIIWLGKE